MGRLIVAGLHEFGQGCRRPGRLNVKLPLNRHSRLVHWPVINVSGRRLTRWAPEEFPAYMFSFIHDISIWLEAILTAISSNFWLSLLFIFLVCIGEAVFILGLLVPSLPILLLTGGLIAQGALPFWPIFFAAAIGAIIGDAISYSVGYLLKDRIKTVWPFNKNLALIEQGERFFAKHGGKAIFIGRFITGVKAVIPGVLGWEERTSPLC